MSEKRDRKAYYHRAKRLRPWEITRNGILTRCKNNKRYVERGIKCRINLVELKQLWFRDKAWLLKCPSIDRIDNDGDYTFDNCRFIEKSINTRRGLLLRWENHKKNNPISRFVLEGKNGV